MTTLEKVNNIIAISNKKPQIVNDFTESINSLESQTKEILLNIFIKAINFNQRLNAGLGKNRLGYDDVRSLIKNYDYLIESYNNGNYTNVKKFVRESRSIVVSEEFVASSFELLPKEMKDSLTGKGGVGDIGKKHQFLGYITKNGEVTSDRNSSEIIDVHRGSAGNKDRGRFVWRCILEQGAIDPYTGLELDLNSIDLEHVIAFDNKDNGEPSIEDYRSREHDDNIIICNTNINQMKNNLSMKSFLDERVIPEKEKSKTEFELIDDLYNIANNLSDLTKEKSNQLICESKIKTIKFDELKEIFEKEDLKIKSIKENARKVVENKRDRSKITSLKSWLGKEIIQSMGLSRGLTHSSGRRTVKLTSDNIYRGYVLSIVDNMDKQELYKQEWENARFIGNTHAKEVGTSGQPAMLEYLKNKNLISDKVLLDAKLNKVWK